MLRYVGPFTFMATRRDVWRVGVVLDGWGLWLFLGRWQWSIDRLPF